MPGGAARAVPEGLVRTPPPGGGGAGTPLGDYGFLSDCASAALVSSGGSVDWWCPARIDAPSVFGRLLDPSGGHWLIAPTGEHSTERNYVADSLVLRTVFRADSGMVAVTDALALERGARGHDIGMRPPRALVRTVEGLGGELAMRVEISARPEYGLTVGQWRRGEDGWVLRAGPLGLRLSSDIELQAGEGDLGTVFPMREGERASFCLAFIATYEDGREHVPDAREAVENTVAGWQSWSALHQGYQGRNPALVRRSALVLQGLTYQRSGAVAAAATTSLPESLGGDLNWDYRFAWLRDISLTMQALWVAACPHEGRRFFDWLAGAIGQVGDKPLQIMFGVAGERDLTERTLDHFAGYRDSRPVRVGNNAWKQRQLDVLGEVLFAARLLREQIAPFDQPLQELLAGLADQAARDWQQPDAGMWESRDRLRHYTSSKVMCWVALDSAIALADHLGNRARPDEWRRARDGIRAAVLEQAWSEQAGAYAGAFGSDSLDASVLLLPLVGFLPADDPRMWATIQAICDRLGDGVLVRRWAGDTAGFVICSFWMVECFALGGHVTEATDRFDRLVEYGNDLGLFAEVVDPAMGLLGNFPQAFSHVGLVNAAWRLTQATDRDTPR
jgi:GH15 family glucan-1,4-alpha-glucosidase